MAAITSYTSYDYAPVEILPVIVSFDTAGKLSPLYVRIAGEAYKVESFWTASKFVDCMEYHCKLQVGDYLRPLVITYHNRENVWTIPKAAGG